MHAEVQRTDTSLLMLAVNRQFYFSTYTNNLIRSAKHTESRRQLVTADTLLAVWHLRLVKRLAKRLCTRRSLGHGSRFYRFFALDGITERSHEKLSRI